MTKNMPQKKKSATKPAPKSPRPKTVAAFTHDKAERKNIPTAEMQGLVPDSDAAPVTVAYPRKNNPAQNPERYTRNPDYDPQLVWKGKDEEDAKPLTISAMPIYVQEKIHPRAIIEDLRRHCANQKEADSAAQQLFGDFNGLPDIDARVKFYKHAQRWTNRMILGDSLQVMASLANKEDLRGQVQCFYMDPPYGIKYQSNWQPSTKSTKVEDSDESVEPEVVRAFRDTWKNDVHSYLSYLRDRLRAARDLLTESGSAFVQIGTENVHLVRCVMDEIFGRENFVGMITYKTTGGMSQAHSLKRTSDYIIWYAKNGAEMKFNRLYKENVIDTGTFGALEDADGNRRAMTRDEKDNPEKIPSGMRPFTTLPVHSKSGNDNSKREFAGKKWGIPSGSWRYSLDGFNRLAKVGRIVALKTALRFVYYFDDFGYTEYTNNWTDTGPEMSKDYAVQTSERVIQRCVLMSTDPGDLVLDSTCGSGTTAVVAEEWGRRWITCDTSRVSLAIARARLMAKGFDYYMLADSEAGAQKEMELSGTKPKKKSFANDIRQGFVYQRASQITPRDIANNKEIDDILEAWNETLEPLRETINTVTGNKWQEWEMPEVAGDDWKAEAKDAHAKWQKARAERQQQINGAIQKNAANEKLRDKPYEDKSIMRVTGPFTVESLSPYRMLPTSDDAKDTAKDARPRSETENETRFWDVVFENLRATGVQTAEKGARIEFDELEKWPSGSHIQFAGKYKANGKTRRAAVCVGPEYGTVGRSLLVGAAREAADMFDLLIVLGFAFEAHADSEMTNLGRLPVLRARMNADLQMADRLKTGKDARDNLFVAFGEPDIDLQKTADDRLRVEIFGLDIYNPATGEVKRGNVDDIACWFIDTDYNEQSFFVRHAYFCGGGKNPYKDNIAKVKKALRAEIDEEAWQGLYGAQSRPFAPPTSGKIAVKAINHYGDEVIKVFPVGE